jgi:hypothetical protein
VSDDRWAKQHNALLAEFSDGVPDGIRREPLGVEIDPSKPIYLHVEEGRRNQAVGASDSIGQFRSSHLDTVNRTSCNGDFDQFIPSD